MEYLNDEMDDLFRKAGEDYPLKTSDSDWDGVLGRLQSAAGDESPFVAQEGKKKNNRRRFLWLLLLLPAGLFSLKFFQAAPGNNKNKPSGIPALSSNTASAEKINDPATTTIAGSKDNNPSVSTIAKADQQHVAGDNTNTSSDAGRNRHAVAGKNPNTESEAAKGQQLLRALPAAVRQQKAGGEQHTLTVARRKQTGINGRINNGYPPGSKPGTEKESNPVSGANGNSEAVTQLPATSSPAATMEAGADKSAGAANTSDAGIAAGNGTDKATTDQTAKDVSIQQDVAKKERTVNNAAGKDSITTKKKTQINPVAEKGIYVSLVGGPDFSTVKFQSVKNMGYSLGLLAGYRFNKHISLEVGIFWDKKQYYTKGEYFNKSKTNIPASYDIRDLDGNCQMFEIPIALRYDFSYNRKGRFFSTAGFSSYLMKKENYAYTAEYGGSAWAHNASYKNSGNNLLSILQLSAGYEYGLGKIGRLRVEPYFKIPLTGVGIGQLAISSAGLHLGITHSFR